MNNPKTCQHQINPKYIFWGKRKNRGTKEKIAITECKKCGYIIQLLFIPLRPISESVHHANKRNNKQANKPERPKRMDYSNTGENRDGDLL